MTQYRKPTSFGLPAGLSLQNRQGAVANAVVTETAVTATSATTADTATTALSADTATTADSATSATTADTAATAVTIQATFAPAPPSGIPADGAFHFDTSAIPAVGYIGDSGVWNQF